MARPSGSGRCPALTFEQAIADHYYDVATPPTADTVMRLRAVSMYGTVVTQAVEGSMTMAYIITPRPGSPDYDDGWVREDQWGDSIQFKVLAGRMTEVAREPATTTAASYPGPRRRPKRMDKGPGRGPAATSRARVCRHEYDCCGCASTFASVRHVGRGEFSVRIRTTYNY